MNNQTIVMIARATFWLWPVIIVLGILLFNLFDAIEPVRTEKRHLYKEIALALLVLAIASNYVVHKQYKEIETPIIETFIETIQGKEITGATIQEHYFSKEVLSVTYRDADGEHSFVFKDYNKDTIIGKEISILDSEDDAYHVAYKHGIIRLYVPTSQENYLVISQ